MHLHVSITSTIPRTINSRSSAIGYERAASSAKLTSSSQDHLHQQLICLPGRAEVGLGSLYEGCRTSREPTEH